MAVSVLCIFLTVPGVPLQCVIVAFSGHTHLLSLSRLKNNRFLHKPDGRRLSCLFVVLCWVLALWCGSWCRSSFSNHLAEEERELVA